MTTTHPDFKPGDWVIYRPSHGGEAEDGEVIRVTDDLVMVLYCGDRTPKATRPEDLVHGLDDDYRPCRQCFTRGGHKMDCTERTATP